MSGGIKPPGGGTTPIDPSWEPDALAQADETSAASATESAAEAAPTRGTAAWLERVDAGEISPEQAVDGIVAEALERHGVSQLDAARRAELETVLREALLEDPVLSGLLQGRAS